MRLLKGNIEVVAPISAPMLQIVAIPVQDRDSTPGPLYSTMAPVPPLTVRMPATLRMTSGAGSKLGRGVKRSKHTLWCCPSSNFACQVDANDFGTLEFPRNASHNIDCICTTYTTCNHPETTSIGSVRVGSYHEPTGERVVFENDLMDDTRAWFPEPESVWRNVSARKNRRGDRIQTLNFRSDDGSMKRRDHSP